MTFQALVSRLVREGFRLRVEPGNPTIFVTPTRQPLDKGLCAAIRQNREAVRLLVEATEALADLGGPGSESVGARSRGGAR